MDIIGKFGNVVGNEALKDPDKARRLLLARIPASGEKTTAFSGPGASAVRAVCGTGGYEKYHSGTCKTAKFGNDEHFRSGRAFNGGRTDTVFRGSAVLFYSRYKM